MRTILIEQSRQLPSGMRKSPTAEEIESEIAESQAYGKDYKKFQEELDDLEEKEDNMKLLFKCAEIDADVAKSMSYLENTLINKGLIEAGGAYQTTQTTPATPHPLAADLQKPPQPHPDSEY